MYYITLELRSATVYSANWITVTRPKRYHASHFTGVDTVAESLVSSESGRLVWTTALVTRV